MTQEQITEGNRLIAEFMGIKIIPNRGEAKIEHFVFDEGTLAIWDLKYHQSWDWLMPVVKKAFDSLVGNTEDWTFLIEKRIKDSVLLIDIEQTWKYVVEFAKKHNEKNEK